MQLPGDVLASDSSFHPLENNLSFELNIRSQTLKCINAESGGNPEF